VESDFYVTPLTPPAENAKETMNFIECLLVVDAKKRPVFLLEVKDDAFATLPSKRQAADDQMRDRYCDLILQCPLPILYGLSVLGTKMRVYSGDTEKRILHPARVPVDPEIFPGHEHLAHEWDTDILSDEGFTKMKEIVGYIKRESAARST
jgi:hypothetical protein